MDGAPELSEFQVFVLNQLPIDPVAYGYLPVQSVNGEPAYILPGEPKVDTKDGIQRLVYDKVSVLYDLKINRHLLYARGWTVYPVYDLGTNVISIHARKYDQLYGIMITASFRNAVNHERDNMPYSSH